MQVVLKPGAWVDPAKMTQAIRDAGFTPVPEDVRFTLTGTLEARDGHIVLVLDAMDAPRNVTCVAAQGRHEIAAALSDNTGKTVEIRGRWLFKDEADLEVESISPLPGGP
ncbi:MAG TPA: hypothetical protein VKF61_10855 [Candidatus Polarisedimenticolia bacterium]|nr:hypothetical protein [Candidatus Polarisedimenticolia bacterium]